MISLTVSESESGTSGLFRTFPTLAPYFMGIAPSCSQCESCFSRSLKAKAPKAPKFSGLGMSFSPVSAFGSDSYHATSLIISASTVYLRYPFSPQCVEIMYVSSVVKHSNFHVPSSNKEAPPLILT